MDNMTAEDRLAAMEKLCGGKERLRIFLDYFIPGVMKLVDDQNKHTLSSPTIDASIAGTGGTGPMPGTKHSTQNTDDMHEIIPMEMGKGKVEMVRVCRLRNCPEHSTKTRGTDE